MIVTNLNATGLTAPDIYTQIVAPPSYVRGVPTDVIGLVGTASWGKVNQPTHMGNGQDATSAFGAMSAASLTDSYDLATDLFLAFGQAGLGGTIEAWGVRVTDGTDTAATGTVAGASAVLKTATFAGSIANADVMNIVFTSTAITGSPVTVSITSTGADTLTTLAAKMAAKINATAALTAVGVYATSASAVASIYSPAALTPAITYTSSISPGSETVTLANGTATTAGAVVTAQCTGVLGNQITDAITAGSILNTFTYTIYPFAGTPEQFANIPATNFWTALVAAVNSGLNGVRGPSQYLTLSAPNPAVGAPTVQSNTLAGGTDGRSGVTTANLLGSDTAIPRTGLFALRALSPAVGIAWITGLTDVAAPATMLTFGQTEAVSMLFPMKAGMTTAQKTTEAQTIGINDPSWLYTGDWIYMFDQANNVTRLVPSTAVIGGEWATQSPWQSALNNPVDMVVGTERNNTITGTVTYTESEIGQLQSAGILFISKPCPGGSYFGIRTGASTSSNPATAPMEYWRMTAFLARSLDGGLGKFVGQLQSAQASDPLRNAVKSQGNNFLTLLGNQDAIDSFTFICSFSAANTAKPGNGVNTPTSIAQHYLFALAQITYLSSVWYFVMQLQGGTTVVTVSGQNQSPPV